MSSSSDRHKREVGPPATQHFQSAEASGGAQIDRSLASTQHNSSPVLKVAPDGTFKHQSVAEVPQLSGAHHCSGPLEAQQAHHLGSTASPALQDQAGPSASKQQNCRYQKSNLIPSQANASAAQNIHSLPPPPSPSPVHHLPGPPAGLPPPPSLPGPPPRPPSALPAAQNALAPADPRLDFFSEHFDAVRALHTKGLQPPVPRVKPLDNVVKCRLILPPELPDSWSAWNAAHPKTEPSEESARHKELAKHRTAAVMKRELDKAAKGNTLDKITEKFKEGPLLLLRRYYKTSVRLQVVTRHASGVRGTATGYLHGFDKFMNLVLMNVDETYTVMVRVPHPYTVIVDEPADPQPLQPLYVTNPTTGQQQQQIVMVQKQINKFRWKRKADQRKRRLHQVFLRGDNIVTITPVLHEVQRQWPQLIYQWRAAGMSEAALPMPLSLAAADSKLPVPRPLPPTQPPAITSPGKLPMPPPLPPSAAIQTASSLVPLPCPPSAAPQTVSHAVPTPVLPATASHSSAPPFPPSLSSASSAARVGAPQMHQPLAAPSMQNKGIGHSGAHLQPTRPGGSREHEPAWMHNRR